MGTRADILQKEHFRSETKGLSKQIQKKRSSSHRVDDFKKRRMVPSILYHKEVSPYGVNV